MFAVAESVKYIFRSDHIYSKILNWKENSNSFIFENCISLTFGFHDEDLCIPQFSMTTNLTLRQNLYSPNNCYFVMIGGKYINKIGDVMEKVNSVTNNFGGKRPLAVFLLSDNYNEDIIIDYGLSVDYVNYLDYGFERFKATPVMVKYLEYQN